MVNKKLLIVFVLSLVFFSCNKNKMPKEVEKALLLAGENKSELLKVINKYSKNPNDSLKLKSAYYLIANMPYHSFKKGNKIFDKAFVLAGKERERQIKENPREKNPKDSTHTKLGVLLDLIAKSNRTLDTSPVLHYDLKYIDSQFLMDNIELAFMAHKKMPLKLCENFNDFLYYILPYRVGGEPIEVDKRKEIHEEYSWVYDSLKTNSLDKVVERIYDINRFRVVPKRHPTYNYPYSITQMDHIKIGDCGDITNYIVSILRALGIPAGVDFTTKLGTSYKSEYHTWVFYLNNGHQRSLNSGPVYYDLKKSYKLSSIPKAYRQYYHKNIESPNDVTHLYRDVFDVNIPAIWNIDKLNNNNVFLGIYDNNKDLFKVATAEKINNKSVFFKSMGNNIIYFPYVNNPDNPINYPFELTKDGKIIFFNDTETLLGKAKLLRKYAPFMIRAKKQKYRRIYDLNGSIIQGSNIDSDEHYVSLDTISKFKSTQSIKFYFENPKKYKFFRFKGNPNCKRTISLASFELLIDKNGQVAKEWSKLLINNEEEPADYSNIIDDNQLSYVDRRGLTITYSFNKPKAIFGFEIQARNDQNHINIGDDYELHYWDKKWVSLGEKKANDTVLYYNSVPKNLLYLLKNNSRGKEEFVFKFDDDGNQFWVGCSEYENDKSFYNL